MDMILGSSTDYTHQNVEQHVKCMLTLQTQTLRSSENLRPQWPWNYGSINKEMRRQIVSLYLKVVQGLSKNEEANYIIVLP